MAYRRRGCLRMEPIIPHFNQNIQCKRGWFTDYCTEIHPPSTSAESNGEDGVNVTNLSTDIHSYY